MAASLLEEFCAETDELLDAIGAELLSLEQDPGQEQVVHDLLRHLHTIKGASGLFDLAPLTALVHAAEDLLVAVRGGGLPATPSLVDDLLATSDQLRAWIGEVRESGALTVRAAESAGFERRLRRWTGRPGDRGGLTEGTAGQAGAWLLVLDKAAVRASAEWLKRTGAKVRILSYVPPEDAFFRGEDPVALVRSVPGVDLVGCRIERDPGEGFSCALHLVATTRAEPAEIAAALATATGEVAYVELGAADFVAGPAHDPSGIARGLLAGQIDLLGMPIPAEQRTGRMGAAAAAATGALRVLLPDLDPAELAAGVAAAVATEDPLALRALLTELQSRADTATIITDSTDSAAAPTTAPSSSSSSPRSPGTVTPTAAQPHLRVDRDTLDRLLRYTGELTAEVNALPYLAMRAEEDGAPALARQILTRGTIARRFTDDLQALVMGMRMLPLSTVFDRFPRLVRDHARGSGKHIRLERTGGDVTADADVIDLLGEAVLHVVRNALDHGLEDPESRRAHGKPEEGVITVSAAVTADGIVVEVADDGRGLDLAALRRRAVDLGTMDEAAAAALPDADAVQLAFLPGLSTARESTQLSGRGVGLDAVRAALASSKGAVSVSSVPGRGTTVTLRVARSMSVTEALLVTVADQQFAVPLEHITRTLRLKRPDLHRMGTVDVVDLDGETVPVRPLDGLLRLTASGASEDDELVLVTRTPTGLVALGIDRIDGREEILVKPLDDLVTGGHGLLGSAVRADGSVLLVIDTQEVAHDR